MVSSAKLVRIAKAAGFWLMAIAFELIGSLGVLIFFVSAVTDDPEGGIAGFFLAVIGFRVTIWIIEPLMEAMEKI
jgi:uncharacterized membrane protein YeaQ/YmgE (transglycosylase-associated protein family)